MTGGELRLRLESRARLGKFNSHLHKGCLHYAMFPSEFLANGMLPFFSADEHRIIV